MPKLVQTIIDANKKIPQDDSSVNANSMQNSQKDASKKLKAEKILRIPFSRRNLKIGSAIGRTIQRTQGKVVNALNPAVLQCPALPIKKQKWDIPV